MKHIWAKIFFWGQKGRLMLELIFGTIIFAVALFMTGFACMTTLVFGQVRKGPPGIFEVAVVWALTIGLYCGAYWLLPFQVVRKTL